MTNETQTSHPPYQQPKPSSVTAKKTIPDRKLLFLNTEDFVLVGMNDIGFFQYNNAQRTWEVVVANEMKPIRLKHHTNRNEILSMSDRFIQVSQSFIININYLSKVKDNYCVFYPPFDVYTHTKVGSFFRKKLIERFCIM